MFEPAFRNIDDILWKEAGGPTQRGRRGRPKGSARRSPGSSGSCTWVWGVAEFLEPPVDVNAGSTNYLTQRTFALPVLSEANGNALSELIIHALPAHDPCGVDVQ